MLSLLLPTPPSPQATEEEDAKGRLMPKTKQMSGELPPAFPSRTRLV